MSGEIPDWLKDAHLAKRELEEQERICLEQANEARRRQNEKTLNTICNPAFETALETARIWDELDVDSTLRDIQNFLGKQESSSSTELVFTHPSRDPRGADFGVDLRPIDKALDGLKRRVREEWCNFYAPRRDKPPYDFVKIELAQIKDPVKTKFLYIEHKIYDAEEWDNIDAGGSTIYIYMHFALLLRPRNTIEVSIGKGKPQSLHGKIQTPEELRTKLGRFVADLYAQG
jgi:hypothetical protein